MKSRVYLTVVLLACVALTSASCTKLRARDQLNKGVHAYRSAQFKQAIGFFRTAIELDPTLLNAKLYLATAFASQYIPGGKSDENIEIAVTAIKEFGEVLKDDPQNVSSLFGIASIYYNMEKFEEAKEFQRKVIRVEPNNPEPYYWIGVIDWAIAYPDNQSVRNDLRLLDAAKPLPPRERQELAEKNSGIVKEGIESLEKAIDLRPNYSDAMAYLNLLYRQRADLQEETAAREEDIKLADSWMQKSLELKRAALQQEG